MKKNSIKYENDKFKLEFVHEYKWAESEHTITIKKIIKSTNEVKNYEIVNDIQKTVNKKVNNEVLFDEAFLVIIDLLESLIRRWELDKEDISYWRSDLYKIPVLRKALEEYLETTPIWKYSWLVKRVLKKTNISDKEFTELMQILTGKDIKDYRWTEFVYDKKIDYSDETWEFSLEIDKYRCVLFCNGMEIAETDSYDRSEWNVRLLYEIVLKARDKLLLMQNSAKLKKICPIN